MFEVNLKHLTYVMLFESRLALGVGESTKIVEKVYYLDNNTSSAQLSSVLRFIFLDKCVLLWVVTLQNHVL